MPTIKYVILVMLMAPYDACTRYLQPTRDRRGRLLSVLCSGIFCFVLTFQIGS